MRSQYGVEMKCLRCLDSPEMLTIHGIGQCAITACDAVDDREGRDCSGSIDQRVDQGVDNVRRQKRPCRVVDQDIVRTTRCGDCLKPVAHTFASGVTPGDENCWSEASKCRKCICVLPFANCYKNRVDITVCCKRLIAVAQHRLSAQQAKLLGKFAAAAASRTCGDYQGCDAGTRSHNRALATAPLPAKPKAGNGLPKF